MLADHQGSIRQIVDNTGSLLNQITYDSYGNITSQSNPSVTFRFGYTGREWDSETGQYYYRARYYDAGVGRFISQDPIGFAAGDANLYRYVGNSPTNFTDPSGLDWVSSLDSTLSRNRIDLYGAVNTLDQAAGGFASGATGGLTDHLREGIYGRGVNNNQQGAVHGVFNGLGQVSSTVVGGAAARGGSLLLRGGAKALQGAQRIADAYDKAQSADRVLRGCGSLGDVVNLAGGLGGPGGQRRSRGGVDLRNPGSPVLGLHGNSNNSPKPNHVYVIFDRQTGRMMKPGINGRSLNRNGTSPRANQQVNQLNRTNPGRYDSVIVQQNVSRLDAKATEQRITDTYAARNGGDMPSTIHQRPLPQTTSREDFIREYGVPDNRH
jgi:RHS repeat-associated protein